MSDDPTPPPDPTAQQPGPVEPTLPTVPGYELLREFGRGAHAVVYEARQLAAARSVALKLFRAPRDTKALLRFLVNAEAVAAVCHPNLVELVGYGEVGGRPFLALEWVGGGTLGDRIQSEVRLTPRGSAAVLAGAARGVGALHARRLLHLDLKPGNIRLDDSGEAKVAEVDLGRCLHGNGAVLGQPVYVAPEQVRGDDTAIGPATDVWTLGVLLYECLTGKRPFEGNTTELLNAILSAEPLSPRQLVPEMQRDIEFVCMKCLAKDPADRYPTAAALADDLARFLAGEPVSVRPVGPVVGLARWVRRNPIAAGLLVVYVAGSSAAMVDFQSRRKQAEQHAAATEVARGAEAARADKAEGLRRHSELALAAEKKRADGAEAARILAEREVQQLAATAVDVVGLAFARDQTQPWDENARKSLLAALSACRRAVAAPETPPRVRLRLSAAYLLTGNLFENPNSLPEAAEYYRESVELARQVVSTLPKDRDASAQLTVALSHRAGALTRLGKPAEALPPALEAVKLDQAGMSTAPASERGQWRANHCLRLEALGEVYRLLDRRTEASQAFQDAVDTAQDVNQLRMVAGAFAILAASVPEPGTPEQAKERERYLNSAIDALRAAVDGGWRFPGGKHYRITTVGNADFRPFQDHPEVKKLLARAAGK